MAKTFGTYANVLPRVFGACAKRRARTGGAAIVLGLAAFAAIAQPPALEIKGIQLGQSLAEVKAAYPALRCDQPGARVPGVDHYCYNIPSSQRKYNAPVEEPSTLAGVNLDMYGVGLASDKVIRVNVKLDATHFGRVRQAFTEKYGPPTDTQRGTLRNRMGAEFEQISLKWTQGRYTLDVVSPDNKLDSMSVTLVDTAAESARSGGYKERAKADSKDL